MFSCQSLPYMACPFTYLVLERGIIGHPAVPYIALTIKFPRKIASSRSIQMIMSAEEVPKDVAIRNMPLNWQ